MKITKKFVLNNHETDVSAHSVIRKVAKQVGEILEKTLGPAGRNYLLPLGITNDGRTIAENIRYSDPVEDRVSLTFYEVAQKADREAGDGTTTAIVLATKLIDTVLDHVTDIDSPTPAGKTVMDLSRQLDEETKKAIEVIDSKRVEIASLEDLKKVALTSSESNDITDVVAAAVWDAGKDGHTIMEDGFNGCIEKDVLAGIKIPIGIAAPFMYNTPRKEAVLKDMPVFVIDHPFDAYAELSNILSTFAQSKEKANGFVIVGHQFSIPFISAVADVTRRTGFPILLINGGNNNGKYEDIAAFCDAQFKDTNPKGGTKITDVKYKDAGFVKKIIASEKETIFIGGRGLEALIMDKNNEPKTRVVAHADTLKELLDKEKSPAKRKEYEDRIADLLGGIVTIFVDAKTATERFYLRMKTEDAINACKSALKEGMVRGGGLTLDEVAEALGEDALLYKALKSINARIQANAGGTLEVAPDVMDSAIVLKSSLTHAVSVVKTLLTVEGIIADVESNWIDDVAEKLWKHGVE